MINEAHFINYSFLWKGIVFNFARVDYERRNAT